MNENVKAKYAVLKSYTSYKRKSIRVARTVSGGSTLVRTAIQNQGIRPQFSSENGQRMRLETCRKIS